MRSNRSERQGETDDSAVASPTGGSDGDRPGDELLDDRRNRVDPMPLVVGAFVALSGLLLFVQPVVRSVRVLGTAVPPFLLAPAPLSLGFAVGAVGFARRGERTVALAHAVGAVGFGLLFLATGVGSVRFLWLGLAVVLGGVTFLVVDARRR